MFTVVSNFFLFSEKALYFCRRSLDARVEPVNKFVLRLSLIKMRETFVELSLYLLFRKKRYRTSFHIVEFSVIISTISVKTLTRNI
jgi:hypothetical protein